MKELAEIKPFVYHDKITGDTVEVSVSEEYSAVLRINNRYYYFTKETGEMDGTSIDYDGMPGDTWLASQFHDRLVKSRSYA